MGLAISHDRARAGGQIKQTPEFLAGGKPTAAAPLPRSEPDTRSALFGGASDESTPELPRLAAVTILQGHGTGGYLWLKYLWNSRNRS